MTRRYYDDSYTFVFRSTIVELTELDGRPAVVLDDTYFYPTGGGQPHDTGLINGMRVIDVQTRAADGAVLHLLRAPLPPGPADCVIDWPRRFDFMQQHTGQHILSQAFIQVHEARTVGFHLTDTNLTIDLDSTVLDANALTAVETRANEVVFENRAVTSRFIDPSEAEGVRMRGVREVAPGGLRVVTIADYDATACGGTHVSATGAVGLIKILRVEKYKGGTRVEFVCGGRALKAFGQRTDIVARLSTELSCAPGDLPSIVGGLREQVAAGEKALKGVRERLTEYEARDLLANAAERAGARVVTAAYDDRDAGDLRVLAGHLTREPGVIALLGLAVAKTNILCARSADLPHDMNTALRAALAPLGGKGGGQPHLAQGGAGSASLDQVRAALEAAASSLV